MPTSAPLSPEAATLWVLWGGLVIGLALGAAGQASRFCVRGAIADWFVLGQRTRALTWLLALAVAALGSQALIALGTFDATRTLAWTDRFAWLSYLVGGALFGYGMVLSQGCPQRSLVKLGSGNLRALVTLLVAALAALMSLRGVFAELRVRTIDTLLLPLAGPQDLGTLLAGWLPVSAAALRGVLLLALLAAAVWLLWRERSRMQRVHWIGGGVIGLLVPACWILTGQIGFVPEHPETLEPAWLGTQSRRPEALSFTAPIANAIDLLTLWTDANTRVSFGVVLCLGVLAGSFVAARRRGEFRLETFASPREFAEHVAGGLLMGFGGVAALGCSVGQGLTGLAMLSAGACLAVAGIVAGALLALRRQVVQRARAAGAARVVA